MAWSVAEDSLGLGVSSAGREFCGGQPGGGVWIPVIITMDNSYLSGGETCACKTALGITYVRQAQILEEPFGHKAYIRCASTSLYDGDKVKVTMAYSGTTSDAFNQCSNAYASLSTKVIKARLRCW